MQPGKRLQRPQRRNWQNPHLTLFSSRVLSMRSGGISSLQLMAQSTIQDSKTAPVFGPSDNSKVIIVISPITGQYSEWRPKSSQ